jgi:hypothetical protein
MKRPCIFCQELGKLTEEHLWSDWINNLFGEKQRYTVQRKLPNREVKEWESVGINQTATVVCKKCNNEWMNDIEMEARPMLSHLIKFGDPLSFLPAGIAVLAAFTFKNAIISDHTHRERKPFFSVSDRVSFMNKLAIPDGVQMWIASSGSFQSFVFEVPAAHGPLHSAKFLSFTWSAGYLVFQVLAPRWKRLGRKYERLPMLMPNNRWESVSLRFWPNNGRPITWNPTYDLSGNSLDVFKNRWSEAINII